MHRNITELIDADICDTRILYVNKERNEHGWNLSYSVRKEGRFAPGIVLILDGSAAYYMNGEKIIADKNNVLYLTKSSLYDCIVEDTHYEIIVVNFKIINSTSYLLLPLDFKNYIGSDLHIKDLFLELLKVWTSKMIFYKIKAHSILQDILYRLSVLCIQKNNNLNTERIFESTKYIESYYFKPIQLKDLADISNMSISNFRRIFTEVYGIPPIEYLNFIKISHAKNLLKSQNYTVSEIAEMTGFNSLYYFCRAFKKTEGISPSTFKSMFLE